MAKMDRVVVPVAIEIDPAGAHRETRIEWLNGSVWHPMAPGAFDLSWCAERGIQTRTVERWVTPWTEVPEGAGNLGGLVEP